MIEDEDIQDIRQFATRQPLETQAFFALVDTTAKLIGESEKYWQSVGINGARVRLLAEIAKAGGSMLPSALASVIGVTKANISVLLVPLKEAGYVEESEHPEDGRKKRIALTPEGEALLRDALPGNRAVIADRMSGLNEAELRQLMTLLGRLREGS